jgi:hypothetical protein
MSGGIRKWEYDFDVTSKGTGYFGWLRMKCDERGDQGWELVGVVESQTHDEGSLPQVTLYWKRPN